MPTYRNINRFSNASTRSVGSFSAQFQVQEPEMVIEEGQLTQSFNYLEPEMVIERAEQQSIFDSPIVGELLFPFKSMPLNHPDSLKNNDYANYDYTKSEANAATFAYRRGENRLHAARDLYYNEGEPVYAITSGKVLNVSSFYWDTWVIDIEHDYEHVEGHKIIVRYGEVSKDDILVKKGDKVARGAKIGKVGLLTKDGRFIKQPSPDKRGMLHLEMYTGEATGSLSPGWVDLDDMLHATAVTYKDGRSFRRRKDLIDPLPFLKTMLSNSKESRIIV